MIRSLVGRQGWKRSEGWRVQRAEAEVVASHTSEDFPKAGFGRGKSRY